MNRSISATAAKRSGRVERRAVCDRWAVVSNSSSTQPDAAAPEPARVAHPGERLQRRASLVLEDGTDLGEVTRLPIDLPYGYPRLIEEAGETLLIVAPPRCPLPASRAWGWAVQLYALRSATSWGIGDLGDLRELGRWSRGHRAGFALISPLHALASVPRHEPSPYFPSSRRFRDPLLLDVEAVAATLPGADVSELAAAGRALDAERRIDRDRVADLKRAALDELWRAARRTPNGRLATYRREQAEPLAEWATFCALVEEHGERWSAWPQTLRSREPRALQAAAQRLADRVDFHAWLQWLLDEQVAHAAHEIDVVNDLAVGFAPDGFDAWTWQDLLVDDVTVGAPPDAFNMAGQDWQLPAFDPERLRAARYQPFIETLRATFRHAAGVRIDHVMGLFRLWWVPRGAGPKQGRYVRYPSGELLAIVALEAHRANAFVVGEDLGTVEPEVRGEMARRDILSYRLMLFDGTDTSAYPELALAAVTTHDLPTIAGLLSGADLRRQAAAGLEPNVDGNATLRAPLASLAGGVGQARVKAVTLEAYRRLAASPALLVAATLNDALRVEERPNLPGTVDVRAGNWSLALPRTLEELAGDPFVDRLVTALRR
jgi:4-alpha-glucanotransferase